MSPKARLWSSWEDMCAVSSPERVLAARARLCLKRLPSVPAPPLRRPSQTFTTASLKHYNIRSWSHCFPRFSALPHCFYQSVNTNRSGSRGTITCHKHFGFLETESTVTATTPPPPRSMAYKQARETNTHFENLQLQETYIQGVVLRQIALGSQRKRMWGWYVNSLKKKTGG